MKNPKVSVIMSVYNGEKYLRQAIESILNQTFSDFEFIIVDDGSTDKTFEILEGYMKNDSRIKVIRNERNIGLTKSLNKAIKISQGDYIARMDADDVSLPERLEKQIELLKSNQNLGCVGCNALIIDDEGKPIKKVTLPKTNLNQYVQKRNCFIHGTLTFPKYVIEEVQGYDEKMKLAQDYDLILRISKRYKLGLVDDFLYKLRIGKSTISYQNFFAQIYYTAKAKTHFVTGERQDLSSIKKQFIFFRELLFSFFVIYKFGIPKILKALKLIK
jgi:glycosyltransferase involved in cell wall biosynthesis